jgi:hypothetical protein
MRFRYIWFLSSTTMLVMSTDPPGPPSTPERLREDRAGLKLAKVDDLIAEYNSLVDHNRLLSIRDLYLLDLHTILCEISAERGEGGQYVEDAQCRKIEDAGGKMKRAQQETRGLLIDAHPEAKAEFGAVLRPHVSEMANANEATLQTALQTLEDYGVSDSVLDAEIRANLAVAQREAAIGDIGSLNLETLSRYSAEVASQPPCDRKAALLQKLNDAVSAINDQVRHLEGAIGNIDTITEADGLVGEYVGISGLTQSPEQRVRDLVQVYLSAIQPKIAEKILSETNVAKLNEWKSAIEEVPAGTTGRPELVDAIEARREALAPPPATAATDLVALDEMIGPDNGPVVTDAATVLGWYDRLTGIATTPDTDDATTKKQLMLRIAKKGLLALFAHYRALSSSREKTPVVPKSTELVKVLLDDLKTTSIRGTVPATTVRTTWNNLVQGTGLPPRSQPMSLYNALEHLLVHKRPTFDNVSMSLNRAGLVSLFTGVADITF